MDQNNLDELYHYGRKGMKWGQNIFGKKRSGSNKTSRSKKTSSVIDDWKKRRKAKQKEKLKKQQEAEEKRKVESEEAAKAAIESKRSAVLRSRSAKTLYDNAPLFTDVELDRAYKRLVLEKNIKELAPKEISRGKKFLDNAVLLSGKASTLAKNASSMYGSLTALKKMMDKNAKTSGPTKPANSSVGGKPSGGDDSPSSGGTGKSGLKWRRVKRKQHEVYEGEIVDGPSSHKKEGTSKKDRTTIDLGPDDWSDVTDYTSSYSSVPVTTMATNRNVLRGQSYVNLLRDVPIAGLLPPPD